MTQKRPKSKVTCAWGRCSKRGVEKVADDERYCGRHATWRTDEIVRRFVLDRDHHTCVACHRPADGVNVNIQWAHIHSRSHSSLRWTVDPEPGNSVALCSGCHYAYTLNPANWKSFIERTWPGHWDALSLMQAEQESARGSKRKKAEIIREFRRRKETYEEGSDHRSHRSMPDGELMDG